jgi:hypothetical protein
MGINEDDDDGLVPEQFIAPKWHAQASFIKLVCWRTWLLASHQKDAEKQENGIGRQCSGNECHARADRIITARIKVAAIE